MTDRLRRVFLFGAPRSRTTIGQRVISQAYHLATMPSTNWYLELASTQVLNGPEGSSREEARPFAVDRIRAHVEQVTGTGLPSGFRLEEGLDQLAALTGAAGWLEKTPLHVLSIPEIEHDIPNARFMHFVRDPRAVVASLIRRARANPGMFGAYHQLDQGHDEATWRACVNATLARHRDPRHLVIYSEAFLADPEAVTRQAAEFLDLAYLEPQHPDRLAAAAAAVPSHRPWKRDAAGPVQATRHHDDWHLGPLDDATVALWEQVKATFGITPVPTPEEAADEPHPAGG